MDDEEFLFNHTNDFKLQKVHVIKVCQDKRFSFIYNVSVKILKLLALIL